MSLTLTLPDLPPALLTLVLQQPDPDHAVGVAALATRCAPALGLDPVTTYLAGWLHDLGKLAVPQDLLQACRPLTVAERLMVQAHPVEGESLVRKAWPEVPVEIVHAVRHHHERLDGRGYPEGLSSLPVLTMLIGAADVYDALTHDRCYRPAVGVAAAGEVLRDLALSREVVEVVLKCGSLGSSGSRSSCGGRAPLAGQCGGDPVAQ
ncbi:HD-GYP domain-containing protein [Deinococcus sp. Leaf326]|uniref:HD-GYP domain-containing protein n=1 Tax=Deinococcus sp. Leaf326 TaxID=1736338 RepID=UPI0006F2F4D4|nr:HD domain-containing phosphohydrolase [Deinococcus sp. Leaf326]KQR07446.1 hypothetical protein ASF71_20945 [Deinococcus sp. Leaf326]